MSFRRFHGVGLYTSYGMPGLVLFLLLCSSPLTAEDTLTPEARLKPAPPLQLQNLEGEIRHLSDYPGQVVIVNFWASWCAPCRRELPSMNRAWVVLKSEGVAMLAVNLDEEPEAVQGFLRDFPIDFPVLLDRQGKGSQRWGVRVLPVTFVLNFRGEIVYRVIGGREWDSESSLRQIRALLPTPSLQAQHP